MAWNNKEQERIYMKEWRKKRAIAVVALRGKEVL